MDDIRHIATSLNGDRIAVAEFERRVKIIDFQTFEKVSEFDSILDFGGKRLSISEDGKTCVCGSWERHGIIGYNANNGEKLWQRKDLKKVQNIQLISSDTNLIFAQFEVGISKFINIQTGEDVKNLRGVEAFYENIYSPFSILDKTRGIEIVDSSSLKRKFKIDRQSFATLDIANGKDSVLVSESGGPLSCYDIGSGQLLWRHELGKYGHYLRLTYNERLNKYIGICWPYVSGGNKLLRYFETENGKIEEEINLDCPIETEFAKNGQLLVTSELDFIDLNTKKKITGHNILYK